MLKIKKLYVITSLLFIIGIFVLPAQAVSVDETGFKSFINENIDTVVIIDIRWQEVYDLGHIKGALLIDSSGTSEVKESILDSYLQSASLDTPVALYCNCPDGHEAAVLNSYLDGKGYTNLAWLRTSFALWQDYSYLETISGQELSGPVNNNSGGFYLDPLVIGIFGGGIVILAGSYLYLQNKSTSETLTQTAMKNTEMKKAKELDNLSKLLENKNSDSQETKKKQIRRR
ncbi:MAG: rhodanese-like domain-containing protein [Candidatus Hodarchaeales archaeon]|jgi:rhodanese-related sulfurtransferase